MSAALVCKVHGTVLYYRRVCRHLFESYRDEAIPKAYEVHFRELLHLCTACHISYSRQRFSGYDFFDLVEECLHAEDPVMEQEADLLSADYDEYCKATGLQYFCKHCFDELQLRYARKHGLTLPFVPYEKTLNHKDLLILDQLEAYLISHFAFAPSQYIQPGKPALFIRQGNIASPLEIAIYYVTKVSEQEMLLRLIDGFFADKEKFQRLVCFFEKETWIETQYENGIGRTWVPEKPFRKVQVG